MGNLIHEAQRRLVEIKVDDRDELLRLRFGGTQRLWGVRAGRFFLALWWDPQHTICPSNLRHT
ncbi:MAG: hypothetical protein IMZ55_05305 [Acidobacteria bacterium]|nr:hypothetical protein [Planctomycetota bacterium]MBE3132869.1 hypothetical protein [Acidobacteriota bacterium]